jgi:hypothetical protein
MPNYQWSTRQAVADINTGLRVDRNVAGITTGQNPIFTIIGGPVLVNMFIGVVTVQIQAAATALHLDVDAASGAANDFALSVDSADLTGDIVGTVYTCPATAAGALIVDAGYNLHPGWVLPPGTLDLHATATRTGTIVWSLFYVPLADGAYVEARP